MEMDYDDKCQECARIRLEILADLYQTGRIDNQLYEKAIADIPMLLGKKEMTEYCLVNVHSIQRDLIDEERSKRWSYSANNKFPHYYLGVGAIKDRAYEIEDKNDYERMFNEIKKLSKQEKVVICFLLRDYKATEIADIMKVTQSRISQIYTSAIKSLRRQYAIQRY
jgi:RNA polymerase sigma factor (sigma-70 family)